MSKTRFGINLLVVMALIALGAVAAQAQATRTWVSGVGDDVNPCSRTAPCKTFAGAISKTADGGEIDALDSGGFGAVTITKGITIDGNGTIASVLHSGVNGIIVNASGKDVIIRNISISGAGTTLGTNSIRCLAVRHLVVQNVTIEKISGSGVDVELTNNGTVDLDNVTVMGAGVNGALFQTTTGAVFGTVNNCKFYMDATGIRAGQNSHLTIRNSVLAGNMTASSPAGNGIQVAPVGAGSVSVIAENNSVSGCAEGILVTTSGGSGVSVFISNNQLFNNTNAVDIGASVTVRSFLNNKMAGNTQDVVGALGASIGQQ